MFLGKTVLLSNAVPTACSGFREVPFLYLWRVYLGTLWSLAAVFRHTPLSK